MPLVKKINFSHFISTVFFIGYFPLRGGGSWAALFCLIIFILSKLIFIDFLELRQVSFLIINLVILIAYIPIGIYTINRTITEENPDPHHVVFDEWVGMFIPIIFIEYNIIAIIISFFIFRFFDIFKPFPINKFEELPRAYGVLGDDVIAGIFTLLVMIILQTFIDFPLI